MSRVRVACDDDKIEDGSKSDKRTYRAKGFFEGRKIYEKTLQDSDKMWWSLRFDAENNRWVFSYFSSKIDMGDEKFGTTIGHFSGEPGEFIVKWSS